MDKLIKFGLDFHGVCNKRPELFSFLSHAIVAAGGELHIITGPRFEKVGPQLTELNIAYTHFFSIVEEEERKGITVIEWKDGDPFMAMDVWNKAKADYCSRMSIDLHIDDSAKYGEFFIIPFFSF